MKVHYDSDGRVLMKLFKGGNNIPLEGMMDKLYGLDKDGRKKTEWKNYFPCVIVVRESFLPKWSESIADYSTKLDKFKTICEELKKIKGATSGIKIYEDYINNELSRLARLKDLVDHYQSEFKKNLKQQFSFINNSSIWIRLVNWDKGEIEKAQEELEYFDKISLYQFGNAEENLDYNLRLQKENYLNSSTSGHGVYVTPNLYGDESQALKILQENFVKLKKEKEEDKEEKKNKEFHLLQDFHDVALRILVIDDKVGGECNDCKVAEDCNDRKGDFINISKDIIQIKECRPNDCAKHKCKLCTIKRLLDDGENQDGKSDLFPGIGDDDGNDYFYWKEKDIERYYCPSLTPDFINDEKKTDDVVNKKIEDLIQWDCSDSQAKPNVQIVGVRDIRTALLLLSKYKFDLIFCDYLLDKKQDNKNDREYSKPFFEFLSRDFKNEKKDEEKKGDAADKDRLKRLDFLMKFQQKVLSNRGPLGKMWIMPITGFNQTFIQDLYRSGINLIDYRWNISNGADPITTPWQFLYHLNKFIELQLRLCVYTMEDLLTFIKRACEGAEGFKDFYEFQSYMGAEYVSFMRRYGNRHLILRDAVWDKNNSDKEANIDKSVFATYVWDEFYNKPEYRDVIELNRLLQRFLQHVSSMHNDRFGRQRMIEAFGQLCFFIETNKKVQKCIEENPKLKGEPTESHKHPKFSDHLESLHQLMENLTSSKKKD